MKRTSTVGIVLHRAEVWSGTDYHFLIQKDGSILPMVPIEDKGEHAIDYNPCSIAVAVFGDFASAERGMNNTPTAPQITSTVFLLQLLNKTYGGKLWACGHSELGTKGTAVPLKLQPGHTCPGENFPLDGVITKAGLNRYRLSVA